MQRRKIILCEGKNDLILLDELVRIFKYKENEYKLHRQGETLKFQSKKNEDTLLFRKLEEKSCEWKLLAKSESGDKPTLKIFSWCRNYLFEDKIVEKIVLWLDVDRKNLEKIIADIHNRIKDAFGKQKIVLTHEKIKEREFISLHKIFVKTEEGSELGIFFLLLISPALEEVAKKLFPEKQEGGAITELSKHQDVQEIFSEILR